MRRGRAKIYRTYVLRCWLAQDAASPALTAERFVVERTTGERRRRGFNTVESLVDYLKAELLQPEPPHVAQEPADDEP